MRRLTLEVVMDVKSERFEMRLDAGTLESIDNWRADRSGAVSRSEAARQLIEAGLAGSRRKHPSLSDGEKIIILMLSEMMEKSKSEFEMDYETIRGIIYGGHYWALGWAFPGIFHGHNDREENLREVVDILDMWSFIEEGFEALSPEGKGYLKEKAQPFGERVSFPGFDGNHEGEHGSIAAFLIEKLGRFQRFKGDRAHLNSHMPTLQGYRRMLRVFGEIRPTLIGLKLNAGQLAEILNARRHFNG